MLEDFSSNGKGKRTETYTILFLELKILNVFMLYMSGMNNSNSCREISVLTARGITFGTIYELDGSCCGLEIEMPPKRTSTSKAPAMTQATIKKLVADSVSAALEAQAANMANTDNTTRPRETPVARHCSYKEFMSCQPINFKDCKVKFATGTLTEEAQSWWNYFTQPIEIEEAYKITWVEFKKLLKKKYCPRTEVQKLEDEFYHLTVKENDLKTYMRRGLPQSIEVNVTASKPQTLEEAINIAHRLMDQ
ncbi:reverse transcriptase domain-containing protein, partial [Tanacetum coccineum]